jgi:uncharacterized protein (DUF4415 family)
MGKITKMTAQEARSYVKKNEAKLQAAYNQAPVVDGGEPGKYIGRGFAALKERVKKSSNQPKAGDKQMAISIRLPMSAVKSLRSTGRGWQSRASDYIVRGINGGVFAR